MATWPRPRGSPRIACVGVNRQRTAAVSVLGSSGVEFDLLVLDPVEFDRFVADLAGARSRS